MKDLNYLLQTDRSGQKLVTIMHLNTRTSFSIRRHWLASIGYCKPKYEAAPSRHLSLASFPSSRTTKIREDIQSTIIKEVFHNHDVPERSGNGVDELGLLVFGSEVFWKDL
ncbi:hypothetical protein BDZ94DRAFT_1272100 [Collybia nuda]|uniref:Uncharacterized protein n=1 Tax=Collybia nuda TaxID=64659 RepID=A0A9P6C7I9_9AGAR|nr:hypothetical protein BDZ94DRAFT_1278691 [Collybia nuda]KAF9457851.1 hypothetical protein BDZ94DRAFT_1272100 [Collybia nuda]